jgi:FkbM family methyltransferase
MSAKHQALRAANLVASIVFRQQLPTYFHGQLIWLSRPCWSSLYCAYSRYEPHTADAIKAHLPRGGTFWDVGAHIGVISLFASKIAGAGGHVLSFEPSPDVLALLCRNTEGKNIKVLPYGIGNADALRSFAAQGTSSTASFVEDVTAINRHFLPDQPIEQVTVTMRKLDTLLDAALSPAPSLVKIDIEGFELEALKGADRLLSSIRPKLLIEIHPPQLTLCGGSEDKLFQRLREHRYHWAIIDRNPNSLYSILAAPTL